MALANSAFHINLRHGIWRVTLDGVFFGDYRSKERAMDGVGEARRKLDNAGRQVTILVTENEGL